uniref:Fibronectin type-III domain-containing protein n=1 Tax=Pygocentrus nattereri TaxID=42514 RepID=A0A3B4D498_PYGNA
MRLQSALLLLSGLFAVKVQCVQEPEICPRKEPPPGVLALTMGSEVILGCTGDITVDGVPLEMDTKQKERLRRRGGKTGLWTYQREGGNTGTTGTSHSTIRNTAVTGMYQNKTATGTYAETKGEPVTTVKTPTITTEEQTRNGRDLAVSHSTQPNRVGRVAEEGGAFSVTMEMGMSSERGTSMEYEDYEDYEDKEEGLRVTRGIKRQTRWTRNGQKVRGVKRGGVLRLPALRPTDSGNYSCYRGGQLISTVQISVGVPPETPTLSCRKKFHTSKLRCEWISRKPIIPRPVCYLLIKTGLRDFSRVQCSYSAERSRCWCALSSDEGDKDTYVAKLCVTNTAGNTTSQPHPFTLQNIIKPDPPAKVEVKSADSRPHTLGISWSYPATWKRGYYSLQFEIRYRPSLAKYYQYVEIDVEHEALVWWIMDALPHTQYEVQLRAKDEFDGVWSEWTDPVYGHTWTAPKPTIVSDVDATLEPFWTVPEGSGSEGDSKEEAPEAPNIAWVYVLWVFGLCLLVTVIVIFAFLLRHRLRFMSKMDKPSYSPPCSCSSPPPAALNQPLMAPRQQSQHHFLPAGEEEGKGQPVLMVLILNVVFSCH